MSGQPKTQQMIAKLEALGGIEWLCEQIGNGVSLRHPAEHLGCSRYPVMRWVKKDPDRERQYKEARTESAGAIAEHAKQLLDDADVKSTAAVQKARNQAEYYKYLSSVFDRPNFGPADQKHSVTLSIQDLHLAALQASGGPEQLTASSKPVLHLASGNTGARRVCWTRSANPSCTWHRGILVGMARQRMGTRIKYRLFE